MILDNFCPPALLYIAFSITHIIIDTIKGFYNTAIVKFLVMIVFTIMLNLLCTMGLSMLSWFIVFIPFIMMTIVSSILLFTFGLSPSSGKLNYSIEYPKEHSHQEISNAHTNMNTNYHGHTHLYYRKHPINYNTYPNGSYNYKINLDRDYYKKNRDMMREYVEEAKKAAEESKASAEKVANANAGSNTNSNADSNTNSNTNSNADDNADANTNSNADANTNSNADANANAGAV